MTGSISGPLEWSQEILQEIFRDTPIGVVLGDVHGTIFDANEAFCAIVDYPRDLVIGRAATAFLFPEDVRRATDALELLRQDPGANRRSTIRMQARSGRAIWVNATISSVMSSTNEPVCLIGFVENIDARIAIENTLRENEQLYRQVVESQTEMIVRTDAKGLRLFGNRAYAKFFGLDESRLANTSSLPLLFEEDREALLEAIALLKPDDPVRTFTYRVIAADGSIRWTEWTTQATFDAEGRLSVVQSIGRDVNDRVAATEALRASETRYRRLFDDLPGPAWESDWSGLATMVRGLGIRSAAEFLDYARANPEAIPGGIGSVSLLTVNAAALRIAGARTPEDFSKWLRGAYVPATIPILLREVAAILFGGATTARAELAMFGPDGQPREVDFRWARVRVPDSDWHIINTLADVTEQRRAERSLRESEQMYRDLFNRLPVGAWEIDWSVPLRTWKAEGIRTSQELLEHHSVDDLVRASSACQLIVVNEPALALTGLDVESFAAGRWLRVRSEDFLPILRQLLPVLFGEQTSCMIDVSALRPDGTEMQVQLTSAANTTFPGRLTNTAVDITERKLAEQTIRNSESLYRLLFHNLPIAVWDADWSPGLERWKSDGVETVDDVVAWLRGRNRTREELRALRRLVQANQNALDLAGAADANAFADWLAMAIRPEDAPRVAPQVAAVALGLQPRANVEARVERCDGTLMDLEMQFVAQPGQPGRVIGAAIDVTERKRIERNLLHSQMLLESAQAIAHTGSWEMTIDADELFGSREYWNILDGHDGGPALRKLSEAFEHVHPDDRATLWKTLSEAHDDFVTRRLSGERAHEYRVVRPDGSIRTVRGQGLFTRTPEGKVRAYGVLQDITEIRKAEEAAQRQREELTRADRMISLGILVSGVAHEINNPNHLIMLNAPMLRAAWEDAARIVDEHGGPAARIGGLPWSEMRTEMPELIHEIEGAAERIRAIVAELRTFASDHRSGELKPQSVNDVVRGSLRLLASHLRKATKKFALELEPQIPPVALNAQRLEQVIVNLVLNSCQALPDPEASITVSTAFIPATDRVEIRVADRGIGITPEDLRKIREPFFTTKRAEGGMGLGLAVSDRIVQEHNGLLTFESEPGRGTTAVVSLPVFREQHHA